MQAIILAAGMGRRLKELTQNNSKCMITVNGITLVERMLKQLDQLGLSRIVLVIGHKGKELKSFVAGLNIVTPVNYAENPVYDKTNNIYSLYIAREYLRQEDTLLLESDLIFDDVIIKDLAEDPRPSLVLVAKYQTTMDGTVVILREDGSIGDFLDKAHFRFEDIKSYFKTVNIYKFSQNFSERHYIPFLEAYIQALGKKEYYEQVLKVITKLDSSELKAKIVEEGNWYEIDDIQDLDIAESIFPATDADRLSLIQRRYGGYWRYPSMLDFCYLVTPYFPPQKLLDEIKANFEILISSYPSGRQVNDLLAAKFFGVPLSYITMGNGAAELIKSLLSLIPGKIGITLPTFEEYPERKNGDIVCFTPGDKFFSYTVQDLMGFFDDKPISALVLINPDNPSGNYIPHDDVVKLAQWAEEKDIKLILDESFVDFACVDDTFIREELLKKYPCTIVVKSISKAYGVPGLRLGILACSDTQLIEEVRKDLPIWNINSFAESYMQICEKYYDFFLSAMTQFYPVRDAMYDSLKNIDILEPIPSKANYITCRLNEGVSAYSLTEYLLAHHNILIKDISGKSGVNGEYIRVAVKLPEENARLVDGIEQYAKTLFMK